MYCNNKNTVILETCFQNMLPTCSPKTDIVSYITLGNISYFEVKIYIFFYRYAICLHSFHILSINMLIRLFI